jgi:hypothetical protein
MPEVCPSDKVLNSLKAQGHISIEPASAKEIVRLAVEALNSARDADGKPGRESGMAETDAKIFERG